MVQYHRDGTPVTYVVTSKSTKPVTFYDFLEARTEALAIVKKHQHPATINDYWLLREMRTKYGEISSSRSTLR